MIFSQNYIEKVKSIVKPVNYFETLARDGFLNEYINDLFFDIYINDINFQKEITLLQIEYSNEPIEEINKEYLNAHSDKLSNFIETNDKCRN